MNYRIFFILSLALFVANLTCYLAMHQPIGLVGITVSGAQAIYNFTKLA